MTIEIGYFFNDVCDSAYSSHLNFLFSNILYTSILVSVIILITICFTYPCRKGTPLYVTFKLVFYVFILVLGILAIHQGIMEKKFEEKYSNEINKNLLEVVKGGSINSLFGSGKKIKIDPMFINKKDQISEFDSHSQSEYLNSNATNAANMPNVTNIVNAANIADAAGANMSRLASLANSNAVNFADVNSNAVNSANVNSATYEFADSTNGIRDSNNYRPPKVTGSTVEEMLAELGA